MEMNHLHPVLRLSLTLTLSLTLVSLTLTLSHTCVPWAVIVLLQLIAPSLLPSLSTI